LDGSKERNHFAARFTQASQTAAVDNAGDEVTGRVFHPGQQRINRLRLTVDIAVVKRFAGGNIPDCISEGSFVQFVEDANLLPARAASKAPQ
jgi:hypothetical protein